MPYFYNIVIISMSYHGMMFMEWGRDGYKLMLVINRVNTEHSKS